MDHASVAGAYADPQRATVQLHAVATGNLPYRQLPQSIRAILRASTSATGRACTSAVAETGHG